MSSSAEQRRGAQVMDARDHARQLRDLFTERGNKIGEVAEEIDALTDAVGWLAAEVRADRIENYDRTAREQEGKPPLPKASETDYGEVV